MKIRNAQSIPRHTLGCSALSSSLPFLRFDILGEKTEAQSANVKQRNIFEVSVSLLMESEILCIMKLERAAVLSVDFSIPVLLNDFLKVGMV